MNWVIGEGERVCLPSGESQWGRRKKLLTLGLLAMLAVVTYLPVFWQPFISDDYVQIDRARKYGGVDSWSALAADPLYRSRATSLILTYWTERWFGLNPVAYYGTSVALHVLAVWMVFAFGAWPAVGWRMTAVAAAFFAIYEGHQEAVMWYAAVPELLVFVFGLAAVWLWMRWLRGGGAWAYAAAAGCFLLALLSKESGVAVVPVMVLLAWFERRSWLHRAAVIPLVVTAGLYGWAIFAAKEIHLHLNDGTFSFHSAFWTTWVNSTGRLMWIWGLLSAGAILAWGAWKRRMTALGMAAAWVAITLLPYCFLTYMPRVPSRHTYLASAGLAVLVAAGFLAARERFRNTRRWVAPALAVVIVAHNCGYIWLKKTAQFAERAQPTERLVAEARSRDGVIPVHCFPYGIEVAHLAVEMMAGKPRSILASAPARPGARPCPGEPEVPRPAAVAQGVGQAAGF